MFIRPLAVVTVCLGLTLGFTSLLVAQNQDDHPTAQQLYERGIAQFEAGDREGARQTLRNVDAMQLPREQRLRMYRTLQQIDLGTQAPAVQAEVTPAEPVNEPVASPAEPMAQEPAPAAPAEPMAQEPAAQPAAEPMVVEPVAAPEPTPAELMVEADRLAATTPSRAAALYEQVIEDAQTSDALRERAQARLAQVARAANAEVTATRGMLDEAIADVRDGRNAQALTKLRAVQNSGVQLGWFDQERLDRALAIAAREMEGPEIAPAETTAEAEFAEPVTMEPAAIERGPALQAQPQVQPEPEMAQRPEAEPVAPVAAARTTEVAPAETVAEAEYAQPVEMEAAAIERGPALQAQPQPVQAEPAPQPRPQMAQAQPTRQPEPRTVVEEPAAQPAQAEPEMTLLQSTEPMEAQAQRDPVQAPSVEPATMTAEPYEQMQPTNVGGAQRPTTVQGDLMERVRQAAVQERLNRAQQAMAQGQSELAVYHLNQAQQLAPGNAQIQEMLVQARTRSEAVPTGPQGPLVRQQMEAGIAQQAARARFDTAMDRAQRLAERNDFAAAIDAVAQARVVLEQNANLFPAEQYRDMRSSAVELQEAVQNRQRAFEAEQQRLAEIERGQREAAARAEARANREQQINELLLRARDLQRDQKYGEALELVEQALFLDPTNVPAQFMQNVLVEVRLLTEQRRLLSLRSTALMEQGTIAIEETTPYADLVTYPAHWPELSQQRIASVDPEAGESEANRRASLKLREPLPARFDGYRLENVINFLRDNTGVNFDVRWNQLQAAGIDRDTPINLQLENVPVEVVLDRVLQQISTEFEPITYSLIDGIVTISTQRDLQQTTVIRSYDIRDLLLQPLNGFDTAPEFDLDAALSQSGGGGGGGGGGESIFGDDDEDDEERLTRTELVQQIITLIQNSVGRQEEWDVYGGDVSRVSEINSQLIVRTTPQNHRQILDLLAQLRETRSIMISVESRFLVVNDNFLEEVGVDLDFQINDIGGNFGPIKVAQDSAAMASRLPTSLTPDRFRLDTGGAGGIPSPGTFNPTTGFPSTGRGLNIGIAYIDDLEVNLLVQATQSNLQSISLTAPRVTFLNGYGANVTVTRQITFVSDLEPVPDAIGFDVTISVVNSGVVLQVEGAVSADRRYVTLNLIPSLSRLDSLDEFPVIGVVETDGDGDDGPVIDLNNTFVGFIQLPTIELTTVETTVSIPDQGTLMLGGQRLVEELEVESGVPVLSKIPVLNRLFTNTSMTKDERTLLILVKPTIIIQSEEEENLFPGLLQDVNSYNTGRSF